ncbi:MAG TPA: FtsX-like permease family protein, partial [Ktedonobacterales bacterium]|nr:FtsX-like permease family protein [Ktedonobacterales bacterium]
YTLLAIDPATFPIAGSPIFQTPSGGSFQSVLGSNNVVVTTDLLTQLNAKVGDTIDAGSDDGRTVHATIAGVIATSGYFNQAMLLVSRDDYSALQSSSGLPVTYNLVFANVPGGTDANAATAKTDISNQFPFATVTTTKDALQNNEDSVQQIRYFLQIVGLLALLIGGVGIINTMQVLLRRRRIEIAMLKTTGYRRRDLYALFGLEAALIGLGGGVIGSAAGIGVSFLVKGLVENAFLIQLPATVDPLTVGAGVAIGFFTALIFGLMPIVQASQVRPQAVLRDVSEGTGTTSFVLTLVLAGLLALLFFALAYSILQNLGVAIGAVGGAGIFLLLLSLFFGLVVFLISKLPVLERIRWWYLLLIGAGVLVSAAMTYAVPAFGILFLAISLLGLVIVILPRTWKANVKMALRNIGRQKVRTVTTLVALFIGVFAIGLILTLGQNIQTKINDALSSAVQYNAYIFAGAKAKPALDEELTHISGLHGELINTGAQGVTPVSINGVPVTTILQGATGSGASKTGREETLAYLTQVEGFDLANHSLPDATITNGRNLGPADAGTNNIIMPTRSGLAPLNLKPGDTITLTNQATNKVVTLTVVGLYTSTSLNTSGMLSDNSVPTTLTNGNVVYIYSLKMDPKTAQQQLNEISKAVPGVTPFSLAELTLFINQLLNNLIIMLTAIASLAMIAGIIIIANAVALAMLERRRELGILKSVGYTSRSVLSEVLVENGIVGFTGGVLAMLLVTLALTVLGKLVFKTDFGFGAPIVLGLVFGTAAICMIVAASVAWGATRVRPLEVLRYE